VRGRATGSGRGGDEPTGRSEAGLCPSVGTNHDRCAAACAFALAGPPPTPPPPPPPVWGGDPDVGVSSSFLRARADVCDSTSQIIRKTRGAAEDANGDLAKAAPGWSFVGSIDDMQSRWEGLLKVVTGRLDEAARNFRDSADAYDQNEVSTSAEFADLGTPNPFG
jgi:hypothetical protein